MGIMYSLVRTKKDTYHNEQMRPMYVGVFIILNILYVSLTESMFSVLIRASSILVI